MHHAAPDHPVERFLLLIGRVYSLLLGGNHSIPGRNILLSYSIECACGLKGPLRRDIDVAPRLCRRLLLAPHPAGVDAERRHDMPHRVNGHLVTICRRYDPRKEIGSPDGRKRNSRTTPPIR
jgi:hypothetical protein